MGWGNVHSSYYESEHRSNSHAPRLRVEEIVALLLISNVVRRYCIIGARDNK